MFNREFYKRNSRLVSTLFLLALLLIHPLTCGCNNSADSDSSKQGLNSSDQPAADAKAHAKAHTNVQQIVSSEELILALTNELASFNRSAKNLVFPFDESESLFDETFLLVDLQEVRDSSSLNSFMQRDSWSFSTEQEWSVTQGTLWQPFFQTVRYLDQAKFYLIDGLLNQEMNQFHSSMGFAAAGQNKQQYFSANARISVVWNLEEETGKWKIGEWKTESFESHLVEQPLFKEIMSSAVADQDLALQLSRSEHEQITRQLIDGAGMKREGKYADYPLHFPEVSLEHEGIAVTDINQDGLDDFYLARQFGGNLLFQNNGDGTFKEMANEYGIAIQGSCTSALFVDVDNDGDKDLFVGRARERALFLLNEDNKFTIQSADQTGIELPFMVSAISAADVDNDSLLEIYFSTYSPIEGTHGISSQNAQKLWPKYFLSESDGKTYSRKAQDRHSFKDVVGPPNLLLKNLGQGKFAVHRSSELIGVWRKTFQSSWFDFDSDGDQDLYICNDFAPDDVFENLGDESFARANEKLGITELGFGMGVTLGDHNNDGKQDIYVSNMFSKAGTRITQQVDGIDPQLKQMAAGNFLYEGRELNFELVSLKDAPHQIVSKAGWSWSGQFADVDNDGFLDLHVAAGYYTAPGDSADQVDL